MKVAGQELTGITVIDLDASVVKVAGDLKENAQPTYKGGVGFVPNLATCDNVDDVLVIDPRPGNATSNDAADNIAALDAAIATIPGIYRRKVLIRLDGAGFSHKLLEHIASGGGVRGRSWEFSVGWACTDKEIDAIDRTPKQVWQPGIEQDGTLVEDTWVGRHHRAAGPLSLDRDGPRAADPRPRRTAAPQVRTASRRRRRSHISESPDTPGRFTIHVWGQDGYGKLSVCLLSTPKVTSSVVAASTCATSPASRFAIAKSPA